MKQVLWLLVAIFMSSSPAAEVVRSGFADRDISPEIGMERPGGYGKAYHTKFHDPCRARAAVFDDGENVVALVGVDALIIHRPQVEAARKLIAEKTGIAPEAIMIAASHSHSSGPVGMVLPGEYDHASDRVQELAYEESSMADPKYLEVLVNGIADAVISAYEKRAENKLGFGLGKEETVSFNRRWRMKNGRTETHPRYGNPGMIEEAGPISPEVGVIGAWDAEGNLVGCVVNWACHATTSPPGISANFVWYLEHVIRGTFGEDVPVVFLNGPSGDVTQVDNASPFRRNSGEEAARLVGGRVGAEVVKLLLHLPKTQNATVRFKVEMMEFGYRSPSSERLKESLKLTESKPTEAAKLNDYIWAKEIVLLDAMIAANPKREVEVQAIQVGPAVFVSSPAEYFVEYGLAQKEASPFPLTFPVSLANGCVGYVPTSEALSPTGGGYETRLTSYSHLEPNAGDQIRDQGIELIKSFQPDSMPQFDPAPPFSGEGWSYGNVPPELE